MGGAMPVEDTIAFGESLNHPKRSGCEISLSNNTPNIIGLRNPDGTPKEGITKSIPEGTST
jgi:hypothetical protein